MKNLIILFFILLLSASCTVIAVEPYRTADTLGPLHFRIGAGAELGQLAPNPPSSNEITDLGKSYPLGIVYAGMGIWDNIDIYASAGLTFPSLSYSGTLKYKFFDSMGLKSAITPTFTFSEGSGVSFGDSFSYRLMGGELPIPVTYSILGMVMLSAAPHAGFYNLENTTAGTTNSYSYYTYGATLTAEVKIALIRISLGVDGTKYYAPGKTLSFSTNDTPFDKNIYPFLTLSFQF